MKRNRLSYFILIIIVIGIGLFSRSRWIPEIIYPYLGDYLYAIMFFFITGFLFPEMKILKVAFLSILICYLIEAFQLYEANWINKIRSYKIGGLILGFGFLWSDIISYTLGGITGYIFERIYYKK